MERQSDEDLKDNAKSFIPSLKKIYKAQEEILQEGMRKGLKPHQETLMKSILYTLKDMKIGGNIAANRRRRGVVTKRLH